MKITYILPDFISPSFLKLIQIACVLFESNTQYKSLMATGITLVLKYRRDEPWAIPQWFCVPLHAGLALQAGLQHLNICLGNSKMLDYKG